ncbi:MAG: hypothetical protein JO323_15400 [Acidobacteriia bacterium]|nr:hypothetical protein [Terriglobia bacterium]
MFRRFSWVLLVSAAAQLLHAQVAPPFVSMGDSITEAVQSADASLRTQPYSYVNLIAQQMGVSFPLPLIASGPTSAIFSVRGRSRINPALPASNLGVSGANVNSILNQQAGQPVDDETDLVLEPRTGSQMQIAQSLRSPFTICWIGNGDVLSAVLAWNNLNATQMTSVAQFTADYAQIISDLTSWPTKAVVGTIPDVSEIGFVFTPQDLVTFLGSDYGLPPGSLTTLPTMLLIKLGLLDPSILQNPSYVLDPSEVATIQQRIDTFNQIIKTDAAAAGIAVADIGGAFQQIQQNPPVFNGVALTRRFNGGLLSLDGVHPSNIGHGLIANYFIQAANQAFGMTIPQLSQAQLNQIANADPFIDWNGNLVVRGRPLAGLLETLGPVLGISGDLNDKPGAARAAVKGIDKAAGQAFMQQYLALKGLPATTPWGPEDAIKAMQELFQFWPH